MKEIKVSTEAAGGRLDVFLHSHYPDFSRSWIKKLIKKGKARVNGRTASGSKRLTTSQVVQFDLELPPEISLEPDKSLGDKIKIVFENDDFLVIDKAAGISVHPSSSEHKSTIVNWLLYHYPPIKSVGDDKIRPGLVHRLDKETSGLMVVAKNQKMFVWLKDQFKKHQILKKYLALVNGDPATDSGQMDSNIVRSRSNPTKNTVSRSKTMGRTALTFWKVLKRYAGYTLLEVTPKTGRMHQIRVHLKSIGLPVSGDKKYCSKKSKNPKHLGRMFLHAAYLSFVLASGEKFSFNSPLPPELESALRNLPFMIK